MIETTIKVDIQESKNQLFNFIKKNAEKMAFEINSKLAKIQYDKAKEICKEAVDSFYLDYNPNSYVRKYNLYDAYDIGIKNGEVFIFEVGDDLMINAHYHQPIDYVYDITFKQGYHGGINLFYPPFYKGQKPMSLSPHMEKSPYKLILEKWNNYLITDYEIEKRKIVNNVCEKFASKYMSQR